MPNRVLLLSPVWITKQLFLVLSPFLTLDRHGAVVSPHEFSPMRHFSEQEFEHLKITLV